MRTLDHLVREVRDAVSHNRDVQVVPAYIRWLDRDRQWEAALPFLKAELPQLMTLAEKPSRQQNEAQT